MLDFKIRKKRRGGKKENTKERNSQNASNVERWIFRTAKEGRTEEEKEKRNSKIKTASNGEEGFLGLQKKK